MTMHAGGLNSARPIVQAVDDAPNEIDNPQGGEGTGTGPSKKGGSK